MYLLIPIVFKIYMMLSLKATRLVVSSRYEFKEYLQDSFENGRTSNKLKIICNDGIIIGDILLFPMWSEFWRKLLKSNDDEKVVFIPDVSREMMIQVINLLTSGTTPCSEDDSESFSEIFRFILNDIQGDSEHFNLEKYIRRGKPVIRKTKFLKASNLETDTSNNENDNESTKSVFNVNDKRVCSYCLEWFERPQACRDHMKTCEKNKNRSLETQKCNICYKTFRTKAGLNTHMKNKHSEKSDENKCSTCQKAYKNVSDLRRHCRIEGHEYPDSGSEDFFVHGHVTLPIIKCKICHKKNIENMDYHMYKYHSDDSKVYACDDCDFKTNRKDNLLRHERIKHKLFNKNFDAIKKTFENQNVRYECPLCNKIFKTEDEASDHVLLKNCYELTCTNCGRTFTLKQHLTRHMKKCANKLKS